MRITTIPAQYHYTLLRNNIYIFYYFLNWDTHNKTYTKEELTQRVEQIGLRKLEIYEYSYPIPNPKDPKIIAQYSEYIDPYVDKIKDHPDYQSLKEEGQELKKRLSEIGFAPARMVFFRVKK